MMSGVRVSLTERSFVPITLAIHSEQFMQVSIPFISEDEEKNVSLHEGEH